MTNGECTSGSTPVTSIERGRLLSCPSPDCSLAIYDDAARSNQECSVELPEDESPIIEPDTSPPAIRIAVKIIVVILCLSMAILLVCIAVGFTKRKASLERNDEIGQTKLNGCNATIGSKMSLDAESQVQKSQKSGNRARPQPSSDKRPPNSYRHAPSDEPSTESGDCSEFSPTGPQLQRPSLIPSLIPPPLSTPLPSPSLTVTVTPTPLPTSLPPVSQSPPPTPFPSSLLPSQSFPYDFTRNGSPLHWVPWIFPRIPVVTPSAVREDTNLAQPQDDQHAISSEDTSNEMSSYVPSETHTQSASHPSSSSVDEISYLTPEPQILPFTSSSSSSTGSWDQCDEYAKSPGYPSKRGLSMPPPKRAMGTCFDAQALGLNCNWYYNWGLLPRVLGCQNGTRFAAEFVPMIWGCGQGNCTKGFPTDWKEIWDQAHVSTLMGFNEPDNSKMASMTPVEAASVWPQLDAIALAFQPRLRLVAPAMTHWDENGSSQWLDDFFYHLTKLHGHEMADRIDFLNQHDFTGNPQRIIQKANAAYARYGRKLYLSEFAVKAKQTGGRRGPNDKFMRTVLPLLDRSEAIERYAWFSTLNNAKVVTYIGESSLLKYWGASNTGRDAWKSLTTTGKIYSPLNS